jgi:hypothetical protein
MALILLMRTATEIQDLIITISSDGGAGSLLFIGVIILVEATCIVKLFNVIQTEEKRTLQL